ncbi:MAG: hypothetical protein ACT4QG_16685 [Sporichthyaceae bacterium]
MNVKIAATATAALLAAGFFATSAAAAPMPQPGPGNLTADSPSSIVHQGAGKAKVSDANGIARIVQIKDQFHSTTTYLNQPCNNPKTSLVVTQHYPINNQQFSVVDCMGNSRTFTFQGA